MPQKVAAPSSGPPARTGIKHGPRSATRPQPRRGCRTWLGRCACGRTSARRGARHADRHARGPSVPPDAGSGQHRHLPRSFSPNLREYGDQQVPAEGRSTTLPLPASCQTTRRRCRPGMTSAIPPSVQVLCPAPELLHRLWVPIRRNGCEMTLIAHIDSPRVRIYDAQAGSPAAICRLRSLFVLRLIRPLPWPLKRRLLLLCHAGLLSSEIRPRLGSACANFQTLQRGRAGPFSRRSAPPINASQKPRSC